MLRTDSSLASMSLGSLTEEERLNLMPYRKQQTNAGGLFMKIKKINYFKDMY